jgi:hypothetical protein
MLASHFWSVRHNLTIAFWKWHDIKVATEWAGSDTYLSWRSRQHKGWVEWEFPTQSLLCTKTHVNLHVKCPLFLSNFKQNCQHVCLWANIRTRDLQNTNPNSHFLVWLRRTTNTQVTIAGMRTQIQTPTSWIRNYGAMKGVKSEYTDCVLYA